MRASTLFICLAIASAGATLAQEVDPRADYRRPEQIPFPAEAPYDPQIATLGKMLFFDPRLSGAQNMSCASCHNPSFGWETPVETAIGAANEPLGRHVPTVLNAAWVAPLFWDGRAATLEAQAQGPITAPVEMNATFDEVVARLGAVGEYREAFDRLFPGQGITKATILRAIATFERTVVSGRSDFDRWVEGDERALSDSAKRGFALFIGKAQCSTCHSGWNFTDNAFHDIGLPTEDIGRAALEPRNPLAYYAFKTPGLRNIAYRAPYTHNGGQPDLEAIVRHYAAGGVDRPSRSPKMQPFELADDELADIIAFLRSLTADQAVVPTPILPVN